MMKLLGLRSVKPVKRSAADTPKRHIPAAEWTR
jgi:hypothetical protein